MTKEKILQEIDRLPEEKFAEVYSLLQQLNTEPLQNSTMQFAGSWQDMSEEQFQVFSSELEKRRRHAFLQRREDAGITP